MYDKVRMHFANGDSTVLYVLEDDCIRDAIMEECEENGWDAFDVLNYVIEETNLTDAF